MMFRFNINKIIFIMKKEPVFATLVLLSVMTSPTINATPCILTQRLVQNQS